MSSRTYLQVVRDAGQQEEPPLTFSVQQPEERGSGRKDKERKEKSWAVQGALSAASILNDR